MARQDGTTEMSSHPGGGTRAVPRLPVRKRAFGGALHTFPLALGSAHTKFAKLYARPARSCRSPLPLNSAIFRSSIRIGQWIPSASAVAGPAFLEGVQINAFHVSENRFSASGIYSTCHETGYAVPRYLASSTTRTYPKRPVAGHVTPRSSAPPRTRPAGKVKIRKEQRMLYPDTTSDIDWTSCELVERIPGTRILADTIVQDAELGSPLDPCPCRSGAKYKKCCGGPAAQASNQAA